MDISIKELENRLAFAKKNWGDMCAIKSRDREWYLLKQFRTIQKIKKMMLNELGAEVLACGTIKKVSFN